MLLAENAEAIEPGFRTIAAGIRLGRSSIDLLGLDARRTPALIAIGFIADDAMLLRMHDAHAWALEHPESLRRLIPAGIDAGWPPRVVFVAQQLDESFRRKLGVLKLPAVSCFEFQYTELDGTPLFDLEPLDSQVAHALHADARESSAAKRRAIPGTPAAAPVPPEAPGPASAWEAVLEKLAATPYPTCPGPHSSTPLQPTGGHM